MNLLMAEVEKQSDDLFESRRLFHGRGHNFPGYEDVLIDWFEPVVLVTLYRDRSDKWLKQLVEYLQSCLPRLEAVVLQQRFSANSPSRILYGHLPDEVNALEAGLKYRLLLDRAQNIGFFLDTAVARSLVKTQSTGKKVLNLFAYSCSFSVAAIAAGARQVVNLDMNKNALALGKLNHEMNGLDLRKTSFLALELFRSFSKLKKLAPFDLIICDPPAEQGKSFLALRDWPKLLKKMPLLLQPDGEIVACLSSPHLTSGYIQNLFKSHCPQAELVDLLNAGERFPEIDDDKGLSILHYRMQHISSKNCRITREHDLR